MFLFLQTKTFKQMNLQTINYEYILDNKEYLILNDTNENVNHRYNKLNENN